jgi:RNA polymerase sigma-70 factor (ECF subfamily)
MTITRVTAGIFLRNEVDMGEPPVVNGSDTDQLLKRARDGDAAARDVLLERHRARLRKMVAIRIDKRLAARVDPSDIVQEAMKVAHGRFADYLENPGRPFYPWLRGIALDRLVEMYRRHVVAARRSVRREQPARPMLNDESESELVRSLVASNLNPSRGLLLNEMLARVRAGLEQLSENDREILVMRHLEQMSVLEIADALAISKTAVTTRHLRAIQRLRDLLGGEGLSINRHFVGVGNDRESGAVGNRR